MEQATRNKLRNVVTQCRRLLEEAVRNELQGRFGIYADAKKDGVVVEDEARMTNLADEDRAYRRDLIDHFEHIKAIGTKPKDALAQLVREVAFTHLNRLCAYKMMEAREVYVGGQRFRETVSRGVNSNGVKFYLADHPEDERLFNTGKQEIAYRHFLDWLGGLLSDEIGILFSPDDPANRLYPPQRVLDDVLALINDDELAGSWSQDEPIGWVYQYFTPKELRDQARKESQAPRNSYELAFRNQFFTPRYVVEFLTDNTLGRIWYEMRKGNTAFKESCRYMVRRPSEVFLAEGQAAPEAAEKGRDDLSQEELLKLPVYIPHRPKKDPREIRLLDPAVGSAHFLLYGFDLLLTIYEEAYTDPDLGPALQKDYPALAELRKAVPGLILKHNLHGIDIDLRATQISALALWLRCQRAYQEMGLKRDRPKITRSNIVCAEPMPGEQQMLKEFVDQLEPKLLGNLVEDVFDKMSLAGEAGLLLPIEKLIRAALSGAHKQWANRTAKHQKSFFEADRAPLQQRFDLKGISDHEFFEKAELNVLNTLREYAESTNDSLSFQRRLFSEDAVRGFAFIEFCYMEFDVVVMNPPFGSTTVSTDALLREFFPDTRLDLFASFTQRVLSLLTQGGRIGVISPRDGFFKKTLTGWRTLIQNVQLEAVADLGSGALDDATVRTAAYSICKNPNNSNTCFFDVVDLEERDRELLNKVSHFAVTSVVSTKDFSALPLSRFLYWMPHSLWHLYASSAPLENRSCTPRYGLTTLDDMRFTRLTAEVSPDTIGINKIWSYMSKGGEECPYGGVSSCLVL